jgi:FtsP/CotA-like multicopper oxidase with cupredoxin domain
VVKIVNRFRDLARWGQARFNVAYDGYGAQSMRRMNRRQFIQLSGKTALALTCAGLWPIVEGVPALGAADNNFQPDVDISLTAAPRRIEILPGATTNVWSYEGKVLMGPQDTLAATGSSYLGPTFRLKRGQKVRVRFMNLLPEDSIIHWHGLHLPDAMDGHPSYVVGPGEQYTYEFEVLNRAGTYWYHPHPDRRTGYQVYGGLAGLFIVTDEEEVSLGLPDGDREIALVIQDRVFDRSNQLVYLPGGMMNRMTGMLGDAILVNGKIDSALEVETRAYRLRILNGSNARIYRLAWDDGTPLTVISTDGGLLERPVDKREVLLAPGERIEVWADFGSYPAGAEIRMISLPVPFHSFGMGMMMGGGRDLADRPFTVQRFRVARLVAQVDTRPQSLASMDRYTLTQARNAANPRRFTTTMNHMQGRINGRVFAMDDIAPEEMVRLNALEVWEFDNRSGGMGMMSMALAHPMHIHGGQFQVVGRSGVDKRGYVDEGWKDTVLVQPGERVQVMMRFGPFKGLYLYHCHNLEHEDGGMMRNFRIT